MIVLFVSEVVEQEVGCVCYLHFTTSTSRCHVTLRERDRVTINWQRLSLHADDRASIHSDTSKAESTTGDLQLEKMVHMLDHMFSSRKLALKTKNADERCCRPA